MEEIGYRTDIMAPTYVIRAACDDVVPHAHSRSPLMGEPQSVAAPPPERPDRSLRRR